MFKCVQTKPLHHKRVSSPSPVSSVNPASLSSVPDDYIGRRNLEHVEALQENPVNPDQIVIGYGRGLMVIWDLEKRRAVHHIPATQVTAL